MKDSDIDFCINYKLGMTIKFNLAMKDCANGD